MVKCRMKCIPTFLYCIAIITVVIVMFIQEK
jgi:hypothetical protein